MSRHADDVLAAVDRSDASSPVVTSWRRSVAAHGLDPDSKAGPERNADALQTALDRDENLVAKAGPYIDLIFDAMNDPEGGVLVADRDGLILNLRAGRTQDAWRRRTHFWIGTDVSERRIGTNGTGTSLVEERPVAVRGDEHFLSVMTHTTCFAAPIFGPDGSTLGCLNALLHRHIAPEPGSEAFLRMAIGAFARSIETELFASAFPTSKVVLASAAGPHPTALLALDNDDVVVGATRRARQLLNLSDTQIAEGVDLATLRGLPTSDGLAKIERGLIARALSRRKGNVSAAARDIGISRSTLYRKLAGLRPADAAQDHNG